MESLNGQNLSFPLLPHFRRCAPFFIARIACTSLHRIINDLESQSKTKKKRKNKRKVTKIKNKEKGWNQPLQSESVSIKFIITRFNNVSEIFKKIILVSPFLHNLVNSKKYMILNSNSYTDKELKSKIKTNIETL